MYKIELWLRRKASILSSENPNFLQMMGQVRNYSNKNTVTKITFAIFNHSQDVNNATLFTENDLKPSHRYIWHVY